MPKINFGAVENSNVPAFLRQQQEKINAMSTEPKTLNVPVDQIVFDPLNTTYNANDKDEDIEELALSIQTSGLVQPLAVEKVDNSHYNLLAGERRLKAVKSLNWKKVQCKVYENLSEIDRESIKNDTNLHQRLLTDEQKFEGYMRKVKAYESSGKEYIESHKDIAKSYDISVRKAKAFKDIIENATSDNIDDFLSGDLSFDSLEKLAAQAKKVNKYQQRLNDAIELFSNSKDVGDKKYVDLSGCVYYVKVQDDKYVVKCRNFKNDDREKRIRVTSLPACDEQKVMQIYLDIYARENNLSECNEEDYIKQVSESDVTKIDNVQENVQDNVQPAQYQEETLREDTEDIKDTEKTESSGTYENISSVPEQEYENYVEEIGDEDEEDEYEDKEAIENIKEDIKNDTQIEHTEKVIENEVTEETQETQEEFSADNYTVIGNDINTQTPCIGFLLICHERTFIVKGNINPSKEVVDNSGKKSWAISGFAVEVDPNSIKRLK